jgi:hypothetical protein
MFSADLIASPADQAFILILLVAVLASCVVWALWEIEHARALNRRKKMGAGHGRRPVRPARSQ